METLSLQIKCCLCNLSLIFVPLKTSSEAASRSQTFSGPSRSLSTLNSARLRFAAQELQQ